MFPTRTQSRYRTHSSDFHFTLTYQRVFILSNEKEQIDITAKKMIDAKQSLPFYVSDLVYL